MMAMMKAVASSKSALFEDFASRLVILGGMIGFVLLMEKTVESVKVLVI
jgi:DMSO/TMAO reductase YedYZ heme-binding membrane subunit